jgi:hypothetical protein
MIIKNKALTRDLLLYYLGYIKDTVRVKKLQARYALLLGDDSVVLPSRQPAPAKRVTRRIRVS